MEAGEPTLPQLVSDEVESTVSTPDKDGPSGKAQLQDPSKPSEKRKLRLLKSAKTPI